MTQSPTEDELTPTEEELMAFADGELDAAARARIEEQLARSPELGQRLAAYTETSQLLAGLYAGRAAEPVPARLLSAINEFPNEIPMKRPAAGWLATGTKSAARYIQTLLAGGAGDLSLACLATACGVILVTGLFIGRATTMFSAGEFPAAGQQTMVQIGPVDAGGTLSRFLASKPSGQPVDWPSGEGEKGRRFKAVLSFRSKDKRFCRQFSLTSSATATSAVSAIACRRSGAPWQIVSAVLSDNNTAGSTGFRTASSAANPEMVATLSRLMDEIPLDADEEQSLIDAGWNKAP